MGFAIFWVKHVMFLQQIRVGTPLCRHGVMFTTDLQEEEKRRRRRRRRRRRVSDQIEIARMQKHRTLSCLTIFDISSPTQCNTVPCTAMRQVNGTQYRIPSEMTRNTDPGWVSHWDKHRTLSCLTICDSSSPTQCNTTPRTAMQ